MIRWNISVGMTNPLIHLGLTNWDLGLELNALWAVTYICTSCTCTYVFEQMTVKIENKDLKKNKNKI